MLSFSRTGDSLGAARLIYVLLALFCLPMLLSAQHQQFGKNIYPRLRPDSRRWYILNSKHFEIHFYGKNRPLAELTARYAEESYSQLRKQLETRAEPRFALYVYSNPLDYQFAQLPQQEVRLEEQQNINRLSVYFDGNQNHYYRQIRTRLVDARLRDLFYGGNTTANISSRLLLHLPDWYMTGITAYLGEEWLPEDEAFMRSLDKTDKRRFSRAIVDENYSPENARLQKSFWYFLDQVYGRKRIHEILYMTRLTRDVRSAFRTVLGSGLDLQEVRWLDWIVTAFPDERQLVTKADHVPNYLPDRFRLVNSAVSPDRKTIALIGEFDGKYQVFLHDFARNRTRATPMAYGSLTNLRSPRNLQLPMAWSPKGDQLAVMGFKRGFPVLDFWDATTGKLERQELRFRLDWIHSIAWSRDGQRVLLSAIKDGQSDLFLGQPGGKSFAQLTTTPYDELWPAFAPDASSAYFVSNGGDSLGLRSPVNYQQTLSGYDVYRMPMPGRGVAAGQAPPPQRLTFTPYGSASQLLTLGNRLLYLTDVNGLPNLAAIDLSANNAEEAYITNINTGILRYSVTGNELFLKTFQNREATLVSLKGVDFARSLDILKTPYAAQRQQAYIRNLLEQAQNAEKLAAEKAAADSLKRLGPQAVGVDAPKPDSSAPQARPRRRFYVFDEPAGDTAKRITPIQRLTRRLRERGQAEPPFDINKVETSRLRNPTPGFNLLEYRNTYFLDPFWRNGFLDLGLQTAIEIGMADPRLWHTFQAGISFFSDFTSNDIYASYRFAKYRPYLEVGFRRTSRRGDFTATSATDVPLFSVQYINTAPRIGLYYPINRYLRAGIETEYNLIKIRDLNRYDDTQTPPRILDAQNDLVAARASFNWDNTRVRGGTNGYLISGLRASLIAEQWFSRDRATWEYPAIRGDARYYQRLLGDMVLASRLTFGLSKSVDGQQFYVGGIDNWVNEGWNDSQLNLLANKMITGQPDRFAFSHVVPQVRGYDYGSRVGSKFAGFNSELRLPLQNITQRRSLPGKPLYNWQFVAFYDLGMAWDSGNPLRDRTLVPRPGSNGAVVDISVNEIQAAYIQSVGGGLRFILLGLPARFDVAFPFENGRYTQELGFNVSFGKSF